MPTPEPAQKQSKGSEDELALLELLLSVQTVQKERYFRLKRLLLQAQKISHARTAALANPLIFSYPLQDEDLQGEEGPKVNLWAAFRTHLDRLATEPLYKWDTWVAEYTW